MELPSREYATGTHLMTAADWDTAVVVELVRQIIMHLSGRSTTSRSYAIRRDSLKR